MAAQAVVEAMSDLPEYEQAEAWDAILRELIAEDDQRRAAQVGDATVTPDPPSTP